MRIAPPPASSVNTNVPPQNYGGVPPKQEQVEGFNEALNRASTSNDASNTQSSKGTDQSQGTSNSYPIILATRPPINLGNPTGKQGVPLYDGNGSKAGSETKAPSQASTAPTAAAPAAAGAATTQTVPAQPQIKERRLEVRFSDDPKKAQDGTQDGKNAEKPPDTTLQTVLTNSGMKNVGNPPSEADLKTYYSKNGPAHDLIAKGSYHEAAEEYLKLADNYKTGDPEQTRLTRVAEQLEVAQKMKDTGKVGSPQFPPSETNVTDYFKTMKGKDISEIKKAYQNYANAFYVHRGDVTYSGHKFPASWKEVTDNRYIHSDGRRIIDCEGYAYMGQKIFEAAGFKPVNFGATASKDDPTRAHIMVSGSRTITGKDRKQKTEMAVISNSGFASKTADGILKPVDLSRPSSRTENSPYKTFLTDLFGKAYGVGGMIEIGPDAERQELELEDDINRLQTKPSE
jgi:hypothetical protein